MLLRGSRIPILTMTLLLVVPAALLFTGTLGRVVPEGAFREVLWVLPYLLLGLAGLLGSRMNQSVVLFTSMTLAGAYALAWRLKFPLSVDDAPRIQALSIALPLSTLLLSLLRPGRILSQRGVLYLLSATLPFACFSFIAYYGEPRQQELLFWHPAGLRAGLRIALAGPLLVLPVALIAIVQKDRYLPEFQLAITLSLVLALIHYNRVLAPGQGSLWLLAHATAFSSIGTVLLYSVYRLYWRKVYVDELTGLPNRRALDERLHSLSGQYLIAMSDIDHFKKFNDLYGHEEGDNVLRFVAAHLSVHTQGRAYRYGGEEFCIVAEDLGETEFAELLDSTRESLARRSFSIRAPKEVRENTSKIDRGAFPDPKTVKVRITMSFGAQRSGKATSAHEVILNADELLYTAKKRGRNCVVTGFGLQSRKL